MNAWGTGTWTTGAWATGSWGVVTFQYIYPTVDVAAGGWTPSVGVTLYGTIDEPAPDDGDDDRSSWAPNNDTMRVRLGAPATTPTVDTDHTLSYRITSENSVINCIVKIYNDTTLVATYTHTAIPLGVTQFDELLSPSEASALGDRSNVQIEVIANQ